MTYDMSFMSTNTTLVEGLSSVNTLTNSAFATLFLILLWFVIASSSEYTMLKSGILSSFITVIMASLLAFIEWLPWSTVLAPFILMCLFIAMFFWSDEK